MDQPFLIYFNIFSLFFRFCMAYDVLLPLAKKQSHQIVKL